jgi:hypothetical protein
VASALKVNVRVRFTRDATEPVGIDSPVVLKVDDASLVFDLTVHAHLKFGARWKFQSIEVVA